MKQKNIFTEASLPFLNSGDVKWRQMYLSYLFQKYFTFFFCFFFRFFDNVSVIRFMLSLAKLFYYNFSKGENRKDVSIQTLLACSQDMLIHPSFYVKLHVPTKSTIPH